MPTAGEVFARAELCRGLQEPIDEYGGHDVVVCSAGEAAVAATSRSWHRLCRMRQWSLCRLKLFGTVWRTLVACWSKADVRQRPRRSLDDPQESFAADKSSRSLLQRLTRTLHAVVNDCGRREPHRNRRRHQPTGPVIEPAHSSSAPLRGCRVSRRGRQRWPRRCPPSEAPDASACSSGDQPARPPGCRSR